ncbi:hypothetical protein P8452_66980 [Trifolium repens]|nr:hypothetical protein P8452_66980 [Trifolium repens]
MEEKAEESVILDRSLLLNHSFSMSGWSEHTGWGNEEVTYPSEPTKTEGPVILTSSFLLNLSFTGQGRGSIRWGDEEVTKTRALSPKIILPRSRRVE